MAHTLAALTAGTIAIIAGAAATVVATIVGVIELAGRRTGQELDNISKKTRLAYERADRAEAEEAKLRDENKQLERQLQVALRANDELMHHQKGGGQ